MAGFGYQILGFGSGGEAAVEYSIDILLVAGGGGGGGRSSSVPARVGGGGGAGGVRNIESIQVCGNTALGAATVGAGGSAGSSASSGGKGSNSTLVIG